ncbi:hypothetical protein HOD83_03620 [Candidatus Woesearchaeota archaeon]|jgi:hypothetical protein|nr:hypothetical protein [Candidatus Woesearchaeota archaeon]MBT4248644.1 hypothetical protein [Candidatus Woesearchaeota archaeon]
MFKKAVLLGVFLLLISSSSAYTKVTICGTEYTQGAADGVCPDYYFPADAGVYQAGLADVDCHYINISISNTTANGYSGWNLITIPQQVNNYIGEGSVNGRLGAIFVDKNITAVQKLNYTLLSEGDITTPYDATQYFTLTGWSADLPQIDAGYSYWVNATEQFNLTVPYTPLDNYTIALNSSGDSGLNMISWFSNRSSTIALELNGTACEEMISYVYRWNVTAQEYEVATNTTNFTNQFSTLEIGRGYWFEIASGKNCSWTYIP